MAAAIHLVGFSHTSELWLEHFLQHLLPRCSGMSMAHEQDSTLVSTRSVKPLFAIRLLGALPAEPGVRGPRFVVVRDLADPQEAFRSIQASLCTPSVVNTVLIQGPMLDWTKAQQNDFNHAVAGLNQEFFLALEATENPQYLCDLVGLSRLLQEFLHDDCTTRVPPRGGSLDHATWCTEAESLAEAWCAGNPYTNDRGLYLLPGRQTGLPPVAYAYPMHPVAQDTPAPPGLGA